MTEKQYAKHPNCTFGKGLAKAWELINSAIEEAAALDLSKEVDLFNAKQDVLAKLAAFYPHVMLRKEILFVGTYHECCDWRDEFFDPNSPEHAKHLVMIEPAQMQIECNLWDMKRRAKPWKRKGGPSK